MKRVTITIALMLVSCSPARAAQSADVKNKPPAGKQTDTAAERREEWGRRRAAITSRLHSERNKADENSVAAPKDGLGERITNPLRSLIAPSPGAEANSLPSIPASVATSTAAYATRPRSTVALAPTGLYLIGVGDTLEIRRRDAPAGEANLYTVLPGGLVDYTALVKPLTVAGLTTDEVAAKLSAELSRNGIVADQTSIIVKISDYASHALIVSGAVAEPGYKILQREAIPLSVVIADAQPQPAAGRVTVRSHRTGEKTEFEIRDEAAIKDTLVYPGDVIDVLESAPQFYYIGGQVVTPGQKSFQPGLTLSRAVLLAGSGLGETKRAFPASAKAAARTNVKPSKVIMVMRQGQDGRLITTEHNFAALMEGRAPDPPLQPGDRIEVGDK